MIVQQAVAGVKYMFMCFSLHSDFDRLEKNSLNLIYSLVNHKGEGGLYQCFKNLDLITNIEFGLNNSISTPFRLITVQVSLTENGLINYKKVIALVLEFFKIVQEQWLADGNSIDLFTECQMISRLSYDIYNVPEGEAQVQNLSSKMIYNQGFRDQSRLLEH